MLVFQDHRGAFSRLAWNWGIVEISLEEKELGMFEKRPSPPGRSIFTQKQTHQSQEGGKERKGKGEGERLGLGECKFGVPDLLNKIPQMSQRHTLVSYRHYTGFRLVLLIRVDVHKS
ncbi:hypothetical protein WMY93_012066 [Mugilogobius chulae]|uniref:Uncharacterized protein n=1 Tax=Mugilogobius chulae TaxID=88201 RepID=A0AAW0P5N3_9GOBI